MKRTIALREHVRKRRTIVVDAYLLLLINSYNKREKKIYVIVSKQILNADRAYTGSQINYRIGSLSITS